MHSKAAASGKGHFGDLTDDLLRHVLSFLPAAHALQTCVLDTRWRDHWRRTTSLLLIFDQSSFPSPERFKQLVKLFIHLRGNSPLDKCKIVACVDDEEERKNTNTMLLIEYALKCQVKELLLSVAVEEDNHAIEYDPLILNVPLISHHLKCIYRWDLECCPIFDKLKTLSLNEWFTTIDLLCILQHSPVLEMLTLWLGSTKKFVRATGAEEKIEQSFVCSHLKVVNIDCDKVDEGVHKILKFLSTCGILRDQISLMEHCITHTFTYDWDLEWCPIFGKLKTLLLNDWWAIDQLVCILQHSPNLEMLTLHLENTEELVSATGGQEAIEQPFVCAHLKVVNIECRKVDEGICKIWKILTRSGILHEQISIKDGCFPPSDSNIEALELWEPRRPCPPLMARWMCAQS